VQDGAPVVDMTVTTGTVPDGPVTPRTGPADEVASPDGEGLSWTAARPAFPAVADCVSLGRWPGTQGVNGVAGFAAHVTMLLDPATTGWRDGAPSGVPEMRGYVTLPEPRDPDALLLAVAVDALPPAVFGLGVTGWAPTVELTWHMRAVPEPGPLAVATRCRHVSAGGSTRRRKSGTPPAGWSRRADSSPGSAAAGSGRCTRPRTGLRPWMGHESDIQAHLTAWLALLRPFGPG
jgi:hypothetical protein